MKLPILFIKRYRARSGAYMRFLARDSHHTIAGSLVFRPKTGYIHTVVVDPLFRNFGIGERLMRSVIYYAEQETTLECVFLHVSATNYAAIRLYHKTGFHISGDFIEGTYEMVREINRE